MFWNEIFDFVNEIIPIWLSKLVIVKLERTWY